MDQSFDTVIGLEVHVQLNTKTKAFCGDINQVNKEANKHVSVISLAYPGTLPKINEKQVKFAVKLGLALNCQISTINTFDRKHYFYPDLPKGYQITQEANPICIGGYFHYESSGETKKVRLHHIHMEEDAGKSMHTEKGTMLDYNRAGTPLLEVVTEPDFRSGQEVSDFMAQFQVLLRFLEISDANMEEGSLRCDCNVSVKPSNTIILGTRCEIKNLNSKKFAKQAIEIESKRQIKCLLDGKTIIQESRLFDAASGSTYSMRKKEDALDYRYFPDPDLQDLNIETSLIEKIRSQIGLLPWELKEILIKKFNLSIQNANLISQTKAAYEQFLLLMTDVKDSKLVSNFIINHLLPRNALIVGSQDNTYNKRWIELLILIKNGQLSSSHAYARLLPVILQNPVIDVLTLAKENQLLIDSSTVDYDKLCSEILAAYPEKVNIFRKGKTGLMGFFIGTAMKKGIKGINPKELQAQFEKLLNEN